MSSKSPCVLVPLKADAFVLNEECCNQDEFKIAPIVQPDYAFLRLQDHLLESDILDHVDLHAAKPAASNQRIYDIGSGRRRDNRLGVYVHWVLPPFYRLGTASTTEDHEDEIPRAGSGEGNQMPQGSVADTSVPAYRPVPNRWLVTRRIAPDYLPVAARGKIPEYESWVVQSDALRKLSTDKSLETIDLEVDASPLVDPNLVDENGNLLDNVINSQGEIFVGKKTRVEDYNKDTADHDAFVDLHVMTSTNPLLADYQLHNANIFSILDNFAYYEKPDDKKPKYLESAAADYSIIGWHSQDNADPLWDPKPQDKKAAKTYGERLKACNMVVKGFDADRYASDPSDTSNPSWWKDVSDFFGAGGNTTTTISHATMYGVRYGARLPQKVEARDVSPRDGDPLFAVGTSDLDALIAFFATKAAALPEDSEVAKDLRRLVHILGENGDGDIDGMQKYSDEVYKHSFRKVDAGLAWSWQTQSQPGKPPKQPSDGDKLILDALNQTQKMLDNLKREEDDLRWEIFATWWTWISSTAVKEKDAEYKPRLAALVDRLAAIRSQRPVNAPPSTPNMGAVTEELKAKFQKLLVDDTHSKSSADRYYQRRDPTMLFTKIGSGWESDFSDPVQVRLLPQAVTVPPENAGAVEASKKLKGLSTKVPKPAQSAVEALLEEFVAANPQVGGSRTPANAATQQMPYFAMTNRDQWNETQPWRPLFIEWEALYYEVPFEKWHCVDYPETNKYGASAVEYVVDEDISAIFDSKASGGTPSRNVLRIAGRNYLQPQAGSTFGNLIGPVFDNTSAEVLLRDFDVKKEMKEHMMSIVKEMEFVSAPMTAITNSLLTVRSGSHLTPLISLPQSTPVALPDATSLFAKICPAGSKPLDILQLIGKSSGSTPYASSVAMNLDHYPLRPVQHGQFQFIKLNIVDKFGQALHLIDPRPPRNGEFFTACPIVSDSLAPNPIADGQGGERPNVPLRQAKKDANPFVTLPPAINQASRINAVFVKKEKQSDGSWQWRRCSDWDNPIWGWVVVNYADSGIQFFLEDGRFYREIRFGTQSGTSTGHKFLPFEPPRDASGAIRTLRTSQLDYLIEKLSDEKYMLAFWDTINTSFDSSAFQHAPASFSTFSSAIVGKPLALVNTGWSLELAHKPRENWTTSDVLHPSLKPPRTLLRPASSQTPSEPWSRRQWPPSSPQSFTFPLKIGDASRRYDGLICYFTPSGLALGESTNDLNLSRIFTFPSFISTPQSPDPRTPIAPANYPRHTPYWFAPLSPGDPPARHDDKLQILGVLMDPFLPVHGFSGILPTRALQLPRWATEDALKRMTAFWHAGPLVVTRDVEKEFAWERLLDDEYVDALARFATGDKVPDPPGPKGKDGDGGGGEKVVIVGEGLPAVQFPLAPPVGAANGADARFVYLQPYRVAEERDKPEGNEVTRYNPYRIDGQAAAGMDAKEAKLAPGPYTALEGYLQIAKPLLYDIKRDV